jgi:hypothetical protein
MPVRDACVSIGATLQATSSSNVRRFLCCLAALILTTSLGSCAHAQTSRARTEFWGCYMLEWGPWKRGNTIAGPDWETRDIEKRVWFTSTRILKRETERPWFVVRPAPGEKASTFADVRWSLDSTRGGVEIEWDATMSGVRLVLIPTATNDSLAGTARWWSTDADVPSDLGASVRATKHVCAEPD